MSASNVAGSTVGGCLVLVGVLLWPQTVSADTVIDNGEPGHLTLIAGELPPWSDTMQPGDAVDLSVRAALEDADRASLSLSVETSGLLAERPDGLIVTILRCPEETEGGTCGTGWKPVTSGPASSIRQDGPFDLGDIVRGVDRPFLVTLELPDVMPSELQGQRAQIALGFSATGDVATITVPGTLPNTGSETSTGHIIAVGLIVCGAALVVIASLRRSTSSSRPSAPQAGSG